MEKSEKVSVKLVFEAFVHPETQGSIKAFMVKGKPVLTTTNDKLKPFRSEVTRCAMVAARDAGLELPVISRQIAVALEVHFYLAKGKSVPKKRIYPSVKPDIDKLLRASLDALTGVVFQDDGQVVAVMVRKHYGIPERVKIWVGEVEG